MSVISRITNTGPSYNITIDDTSPVFQFTASGWLTDQSANAVATRYFGNTERLSTTAGESFRLPFRGTGVTLYGGRFSGYDATAASISLDSSTPMNLQAFSATQEVQTQLYTSQGLPTTNSHTLAVTSKGTAFDIDFAVVTVDAKQATNTSIVDDVDSSIEYSGSWNTQFGGTAVYYNGTGHLSISTGDKATYAFSNAHTVAVYGGVNNDHSNFTCEVDGTSVAYFGYYPSFQPNALLCMFQGLDQSQSHTLVITNTGILGQTPVPGIDPNGPLAIPNFDIDYILTNSSVDLGPSASLTSTSPTGLSVAQSADDSGMSTADIVGIVAGVVIACITIVMALVMWLRSIRRSHQQEVATWNSNRPEIDPPLQRGPTLSRHNTTASSFPQMAQAFSSDTVLVPPSLPHPLPTPPRPSSTDSSFYNNARTISTYVTPTRTRRMSQPVIHTESPLLNTRDTPSTSSSTSYQRPWKEALLAAPFVTRPSPVESSEGRTSRMRVAGRENDYGPVHPEEYEGTLPPDYGQATQSSHAPPSAIASSIVERTKD